MANWPSKGGKKGFWSLQIVKVWGEVYKATIAPIECEEAWIGGRARRLLVLREEALRTIELSKESRLGEFHFVF